MRVAASTAGSSTDQCNGQYDEKRDCVCESILAMFSCFFNVPCGTADQVAYRSSQGSAQVCLSGPCLTLNWRVVPFLSLFAFSACLVSLVCCVQSQPSVSTLRAWCRYFVPLVIFNFF